jgi:hypothetical protein
LEKDGAYHLVGTDEGQQVRLSEDYFIATDKALPPEISIERPGGDYRASPIEEVTVGVKAADRFGLNELHLHYSVNGGPNRNVDLLKSPGAKNANGSYTLPLEDFKLVPGDLVSLYATARDGHSEARTDIAFIQVEPFEREFSQSQQSGGGGGGNNNQMEISKREKELIAATWKQQNDKTATPKDAAAAGQFLSDAQEKLRDQVAALSIRMQSRDISEASEEFTDFDKDMQDAAAAMAPSAKKLKGMKWKDAIPLEQKALQALTFIGLGRVQVVLLSRVRFQVEQFAGFGMRFVPAILLEPHRFALLAVVVAGGQIFRRRAPRIDAHSGSRHACSRSRITPML